MDFHHPLFRSVLLPALLAIALCGVLRQIGGPRWAAVGTALALLLAGTWVVGWPPRLGSLVGTLPWVALGAGLLGIVLEAARASARVQWLAMAMAWAGALMALGVPGVGAGIAAWALGAVVLVPLAWARTDTADAPAVLALAGLGLAAVAMLSASLLLFELALGGALAMAGTALWLWPRARITFGPAGRVAAALVWLALAYATARLTQAPLAALVLLALAFAAGPLMDLWPRAVQPLWARPLWRAVPAALCVAAALAVTLTLGGGVGADGAGAVPPGEGPGYPYYTPRW